MLEFVSYAEIYLFIYLTGSFSITKSRSYLYFIFEFSSLVPEKEFCSAGAMAVNSNYLQRNHSENTVAFSSPTV